MNVKRTRLEFWTANIIYINSTFKLTFFHHFLINSHLVRTCTCLLYVMFNMISLFKYLMQTEMVFTWYSLDVSSGDASQITLRCKIIISSKAKIQSKALKSFSVTPIVQEWNEHHFRVDDQLKDVPFIPYYLLLIGDFRRHYLLASTNNYFATNY